MSFKINKADRTKKKVMPLSLDAATMRELKRLATQNRISVAEVARQMVRYCLTTTARAK